MHCALYIISPLSLDWCFPVSRFCTAHIIITLTVIPVDIILNQDPVFYKVQLHYVVLLMFVFIFIMTCRLFGSVVNIEMHCDNYYFSMSYLVCFIESFYTKGHHTYVCTLCDIIHLLFYLTTWLYRPNYNLVSSFSAVQKPVILLP